MDSLRLFSRAMFKKWWTLMSCAVFTFLGLYSLVYQKSNSWVISASIIAGLGLFFWSAFLVWNDERQARLDEAAQIQQPDVALVWGWPTDQTAASSLTGRTEKDILVENRSGTYLYNVQVEPVDLHQQLSFDLINEIAPGKQHLALGRWNGRSSIQTEYVYFFGNGDNEKQMLANGWVYKKTHNRGLSDSFIKVPMVVTYESSAQQWKCEFDFIYDPGDESLFTRKSGKRI